MKAIDVLDFDIIKCGVEFVTGVGARPGVEDLLPHMERNENYVYWMQPKGGAMEQQQACICVNGTYYALNNKLEKAIFRNVRLTRDFKNFERLVDGTRKLVIPQRLFQEKLRTSNRVRAASPRVPLATRLLRKSLTRKTLFPQNISTMRKSKAKAVKSSPPEAHDASHCEKMPAPDTECAEDAASAKAPARAPGAASKDAKSGACRASTKRPRKSKYNLHVDCVLEGQKRRKFNLESSDVLLECSSAMCAEDHPLIQTPHTFLRSLCTLFDQEFPDMLTDEAINAVVSTLD